MGSRIYLSPPHMSGEEMKYVKEAFDSNWIAPLGPHVEAFERECAQYAGSKSALALSSGTAAIQLASRLLGVGEGDTFFCSSLTFIASIAPLVQAGARPVLIDSEPESWNISPQALERAFADADRTGRMPKAVVIVDLYGQSCNMGRIVPICERYGVPIIEDAAEAVGSEHMGRKNGSFGRFGFYSFNGNKIITTSGGGMLLSNDAGAIDEARFLSTQARDKAPWYEHTRLGYNFRMSNILAAIGRAQLKVLDDRVARRREIFNTYHDALAGQPGVKFMPEPEWSRANRWLTVMTIDPTKSKGTNMDVIRALEEQNIESRPVWKPMHMQPVFEGVPYYEHDGDVSRTLFERGICLPSGTSMSAHDIARVIEITMQTLC